jgi:glycerate kinase
MHAFFDAPLQRGIEYFLDTLKIEEKIRTADLIITGEGRLDHQSMHGKLISGVAALCAKHHKPAVALCGTLSLDSKETQSLGLAAAFSIMSGISDHQEAMRKTQQNIENVSAQLASLIKAIMP